MPFLPATAELPSVIGTTNGISRSPASQTHVAPTAAARSMDPLPIMATPTVIGRVACARALGFEGKWAIHPSRVAIANEVFAPTPGQVEWAQTITARMAAEAETGSGAVGLDGILVDQAHLKLAEKILARAALA
jgi:hypothetical protein